MTDTYLEGLQKTIELCEITTSITSDPQLIRKAAQLKAETKQRIKEYQEYLDTPPFDPPYTIQEE